MGLAEQMGDYGNCRDCDGRKWLSRFARDSLESRRASASLGNTLKKMETHISRARKQHCAGPRDVGPCVAPSSLQKEIRVDP